jgi:hypothetical protein
MADLIPGENFVNGQQVDDTRLNNHVAGARLTSEAISSRDLVPAKAMENGDLFLVKDASDQALRSAKLEDVRQSNLPLAASTLSTTGTATIGGNTTVAGTFATTGDISTSAGNITSAGSITATNGLSGASLTTSGNASVGGALTIAGNTTFNGTVTGIAQIKEIAEYTILKQTQVVNNGINYGTTNQTYFWTIAYQSLPVTKPANEIWIIEAEFLFCPAVGFKAIINGGSDGITVGHNYSYPFITRLRLGSNTQLKLDITHGGNVASADSVGGEQNPPYSAERTGKPVIQGTFKCVIPASTTWTNEYLAFEFSIGNWYGYTDWYPNGAIIGMDKVNLELYHQIYGQSLPTTSQSQNKFRITKYKTN